MSSLLVLATAVAVSLAVIPLMARAAPLLGLLDQPQARKVHLVPIPRVGGWGIAAGSFAALLLWLPPHPLLMAYLIGASILFLFGVWDDRRGLGHYTKFLGQLIAALAVVGLGDLFVSRIPFWAAPLPYDIAVPFTVVALVGVINAANHADGLDGLAGGQALLSLAAMALLAFLGGHDSFLGVAVAMMGALLGFLRYNTHPAVLFMGDGGSQLLGFTLGVLAIGVAHEVDSRMSPAAVLLLLGLPIADILVVLAKRMRAGENWFRATRNHVHHRLLDRGFNHAESVIIIYGVQAVFVVSGLLLRHRSDALLLAVYLTGCLLLFGALTLAERRDWRKATPGQHPLVRLNRLLVVGPRWFVVVALPLYLLSGSLLASPVPRDFGLAAALVAALLTIELSLNRSVRSWVRRLLVFVAATFVVYLYTHHLPMELTWLTPAWLGFFTALAVSFVLAVRFSPRRRRFEFRATAMDYLLVVLLAMALGVSELQEEPVFDGGFLLQLAIVLYACELLLIEWRKRWSGLNVAVLAAMVTLAVRAFL